MLIGDRPGVGWHAAPIDDVLAHLASRVDGLSTSEVQRRVAECGPNVLR